MFQIESCTSCDEVAERIICCTLCECFYCLECIRAFDKLCHECLAENDELELYCDALESMKEQSIFQRQFGEHQLYQNKQWKQYSFHDSNPLHNFTFTGIAGYLYGNMYDEVAEYIHDPSGIEFSLIPGGTFLKLGREVRLSPFMMSKYVVTQKVWKNFMDTEPWLRTELGTGETAAEGDNHPVVWMYFEEAEDFCNRLGLSLPTEAQWEYAARCGDSPHWYGDGSEEYMWCFDNIREDSNTFDNREVGLKKPNSFGLYDMLGNVMEFCSDWYEEPKKDYHANDVIDPVGPDSGTRRVTKGGSWSENAYSCNSDHRYPIYPDDIYHRLGFRVVFNFK